MFNYRRDFSISSNSSSSNSSSNNNRSNISNDGNQNAYFQRSILDAIKAVNDNCNKRLDSLESKLDSFMQQVMQQNASPSIEPAAFSDHFPLAKYANQEVRRLLIKEADESHHIRDIDCLTVVQTAQSCLPVVAENAICKRLSRLMARLVYDEFGSYEAEVLTEERIGQMKKQFSAIASKINDVAHYTNASTPMKWGDVLESDQDYYCIVLEHLAQVEQTILPGIERCQAKWGARAFLQLAWKSTRQKMKKNSEKKNKGTMDKNITEQAPGEQSHHLDTALSPTLSATGSNDILFGNIDQETTAQASFSISNKKALKRRRIIVPDEEEDEEDDNDEQRYPAYHEALRESREILQQALEGERFDDYEMALHEMNGQENTSSPAKKPLSSKAKTQRATTGRKSTQKKRKSNRIAALKK